MQRCDIDIERRKDRDCIGRGGDERSVIGVCISVHRKHREILSGKGRGMIKILT